MAFVWEQRKVSEIADRFDNLRVPVAANLRTPGTTPYYGANGIQDYVEGYTHDGEFVLVAEDGANDLKNYPVKCVNGRIWVNNHAHVLQARPQIASNQFLAYSMSQANIEALLVGGGRAKLNAEVMMGIVLRIPRLQEQEVIGGYFYKLDQLITLHQRKRMLRRCFFSIDWEQRKLGEVAKYRNGKAHENCIDDDGKYIVVNSKFVSTNGKVKKFSNMQNEPLFENEVAFVLSDVPNGRAIARTFLVEKSDKYTLNQRIAGITPLNETDPYYLHVLMNRHPYFLAFDDGVKQTNLSVSDVMKFESYYPKYEEQETIGRCFSQLDQLITLHQCKSNFCKKNEVNAWEQRKFVEFVKNAAKKNKDNIDLEPYAVTNDRGFIAQKDAHDDFGYMSNVDRTAYNIVPPNSFAYNPARINVGSLGYYEGTENVIVSSLYEVFQTEEYIDDKFLLHWFKSDSFPRWIEKLQEGSVRLYFYFDKLVQCQMMVPSLEEQKRISAYLDSIDQLITLHQWECNINENTEGNDEKQRKPIKKLIISEGNLSLVDDMFLLHRMTFLVCNKYILLRLNVVKYKITIIIISNILYSIVSLLIIACYLIVINKQLIILIYVEISVVIIKGDDDYARIRS
ncbi:restriction endonuclease subunit S [[Clostridium] innocuum]|uniref:restriction endonuclease subunit S n=1 Tax=Clostridium innocuum TaxID=1522 RepID=UPI001F5AAB16|nr:restriction endonuclease subunit S [[Clostridium] innocuum]MCI3015719.1 restriction endonuclease subunit S [[Clostridium] innocuum]